MWLLALPEIYSTFELFTPSDRSSPTPQMLIRMVLQTMSKKDKDIQRREKGEIETWGPKDGMEDSHHLLVMRGLGRLRYTNW